MKTQTPASWSVHWRDFTGYHLGGFRPKPQVKHGFKSEDDAKTFARGQRVIFGPDCVVNVSPNFVRRKNKRYKTYLDHLPKMEKRITV